MSENENTKTAVERLEILENTVQNIIQAIQPLGNMAQDLMSLREAVKLLNNKLDSVVKLTNAGTALTDENLNQTMTDNNAKELETKVTKMVGDGLLASTDTVGKESFVVINEQDSAGKVVNPRMQFLLSALQNEEIRGKLEGAKVGTNVLVGTTGGSLNVLEAYNIVTPMPATAEESHVANTAPPSATDDSGPVIVAPDASSAATTDTTTTA